MQKKLSEPAVLISEQEGRCAGCLSPYAAKSLLYQAPGKPALCLACAELDSLTLLPSGNVALTRRSQKHSSRFMVVQEWNRRHKRYERRGTLVEPQAIQKARAECALDEGKRQASRQAAAVRRVELDREYIREFAQTIRQHFPRIPAGREVLVAEHACEKYSGRVGRSASAKDLDAEAVALAVAAHVRHSETPYDELLNRGVPRRAAREQILPTVKGIMARWRG